LILQNIDFSRITCMRRTPHLPYDQFDNQ